MTISSQSNSQFFAGTGAQNVFQFNFVADNADDIVLEYIDADGNFTTINPSQYTLTLNSPGPNQLWGVGGTITYPKVGSPIAAGTYLFAQRLLPLTQEVSIQNQGNFYEQVVEQALDILAMQIQQVSQRTGQWRGIWASGVLYNFGDVVQDGANGNFTNNYYMCVKTNTSGIWNTDFNNGDWMIVINIQALNAQIGQYLPLTGGTVNGNLTVTGTTALQGIATALTQLLSDNSTRIATTAFVQALVAGSASPVLPGVIEEYGGFTAPAGYLMCYGQEVSRATFATLFGAITISTTGNTNGTTTVSAVPSTANMAVGMPISGTNIPNGCVIAGLAANTITLSLAASGTATGGAIVVAPHGVGNGTTTFNVPDKRGRTAAGVDNMGGSAANRITQVVCGVQGVRLGASGGDQNMQQHNHTASSSDSGHAHTTNSNIASNLSNSLALGGGGGSAVVVPVGSGTGTASANITTTVDNAGSGVAQNVQPTIMMNFIIKT